MAIDELLTLAKNPPTPDAVCRYNNCETTSNQPYFKTDIYYR